MESKEQILQTALEKHQGYWGLTKAEEVAIYEAMEQYAAQQTSTLQAENVRLREGLETIKELASETKNQFAHSKDIFNTATEALKGKG